MAKGIVYVMTTAVNGLIKIGKTSTDQFDRRMYILEANGYRNINKLKRQFAIEVDEYDEKEQLLHEIFSKSQIPNTELFALDIDLVMQLLSSFDGVQVYPDKKTKDEIFDEVSTEMKLKYDKGIVPDGMYTLDKRTKSFGHIHAEAKVEDNQFRVLHGARCADVTGKGPIPKVRREAKIVNNILQEDVVCDSPSAAGWGVIGYSNNGWVEWRDKNNRKIDRYRSS